MAQTQLTYVIVKAGDTLQSIAARYKTTAATIARLNRLDRDSALSPGLLLQVPKPRPDPAPSKAAPTVKPRIPRYAYAVYTGQEGIYPGSEKALIRTGEQNLTGIFPLWFQCAPNEPWRLQSFADDSTMRDVVAKARDRNVQVIATLSNLYYRGVVSGKEVAHQAMTIYRDQLLRTLENTCTHYELSGLHLDWVDLYDDDRELFTQWVLLLSDFCKRQGLKLVLNVPVMPDRNGSPQITMNLKQIAPAVDLIYLLLNTEHRMHTGPGPLSSLKWTEEGVRLALVKGAPPGKLLLGLAGYAYDWKSSSHVPEYLTCEGAINRARQYRATIQFDSASQTPMYRYRDTGGYEHQVWFENSSSLSQKLTIVKHYDLAGIALWRLGTEDEGFWPLLQARWGSIRKWDSRLRNMFHDK